MATLKNGKGKATASRRQAPDQRIELRITRAEREAIEAQLADPESLSMSQWIREAIRERLAKAQIE